MDKKGADSRTILWTFYILLVLIMTYFLYSFITDVGSGKGFTKKYFINDLGLTYDALPSANGNLEIKYKNLNSYNIVFDKKKIKLQNENLEYNYVQDSNFNMFYGDLYLKENSKLIITKNGNEITVNVNEEFVPGGGETGGSGAQNKF